jgi:hypothetical protein
MPDRPQTYQWIIRNRAEPTAPLTITAAYPLEWPEHDGARYLAFKDDQHKVVYTIPVDILLDVRRIHPAVVEQLYEEQLEAYRLGLSPHPGACSENDPGKIRPHERPPTISSKAARSSSTSAAASNSSSPALSQGSAGII